MKKQYHNYFISGVTAFLVIAAAILFFFLMFHLDGVSGFLQQVNHILRPIYYGLILAFLLLPVHRQILAFLQSFCSEQMLKKKRVKSILNGTSIALSLLVAFLVIYILLAILLPQLYLSIKGLVESLPIYFENIKVYLLTYLDSNPEIQALVLNNYNSVAESLQKWFETDLLPKFSTVSGSLTWLQDNIFKNLSGVVTNVYTVVIATMVFAKDVIIGVIISVYLLARKSLFAAQAKKLTYTCLPAKFAKLLVDEIRNAYKILSNFITGKLLDSLIIGVICFVVCNILKFPYPALIATVIGVTNVIPFFGPFVGAIPCALIIFLVSPIQCLYFLVFIFILQQFDGNILGPKILGDSTGLSSFWVLFSILLFGGLFGFPGMVLGVPVFAMFYSIVSRLIKYKLQQQGLPKETTAYYEDFDV